MRSINLSKSKYCKGVQCNKILWLEKNKLSEAISKTNSSVLDEGSRVGELAKEYFGEYTNIEWNKDLSKMLNETKDVLKRGDKVITEASFDYNNNFCSIDILKNNEGEFEIYEVKSSTSIKDIYLDDVSYQLYVLLGLGYKVKKVSIMYINKFYIRNGELDLKKLFKIENVTEIAFLKQSKINNKIIEINEYMKNDEEQSKEISLNCFSPYECAFWEYCTKHLPAKNIFKLRRMSKTKKFELYNKGIISYQEILKSNVSEKYKNEINIDRTDEIIIDKIQIEKFINSLTYPIYFLDFETYQLAIPKFNNTIPYEQIPFQYSLHYIEKESGELKHKEYLGECNIDTRRELAERLIADIPQNVCVTAYNMGFEKGVINKLAQLYPDLSDRLVNISKNIKDLMVPFQKKWYYCKQMEGSYSIKYVLPALFPNDKSLDYKNLNIIHNGSEASQMYKKLENYNIEEQNSIREGLFKYCNLDTYAMVKIWEKLNSIAR